MADATSDVDLALPGIRPREFALIRDFAHATFGLDLRSGKERLVAARLGKHLRSGGFRSFEEYFRHVQADRSGQSLVTLIDALTTNHTAFLREPEHFRFLSGKVLPELSRRSSISMWSAACSTGEEPWSLLFTVLDKVPRNRLIRVMATDISTRVLATAREATYTPDRLTGVPQPWLKKYFSRSVQKPGSPYSVNSDVRPMVEFRRLNLMDPMPASFRFPVIFCRNVMIYFTRETQENLVNRLADTLEPGGYLFVGHAESLTGIRHPLTYVQPAVYCRRS